MEETPLTNYLLQDYGDLLFDPTTLEADKNTFSSLATTLAMKEYEPNQEWVNQWNEAQKRILEKLKHDVEGAQIKLYNLSEDRQAGAYLEVDLPLYSVTIDVSDTKTIEEYQERRVVLVKIFHKATESDPERGEIFNSGMVETIQEAGQLVEELRNGRFDEAMRILFRLGTDKIPRTYNNLKQVVEKSKVHYTVWRFEP